MSDIDTGRRLAVRIVKLLERDLIAQESERQAVSRLSDGAAFEGWLAFETRLLVENSRGALGLSRQVRDEHGARVPNFWCANEYKKVDFFVGDSDSVATHDGLLALEFKLVLNNKNWWTQCEAIRRDLFPPKPPKSDLRLRWGRFAVVAVVGKLYRDKRRYLGQYADLPTWETTMEQHLLTESAQPVTRVWRGQRLAIASPWFAEGEHFFQLHLLAAGGP